MSLTSYLKYDGTLREKFKEFNKPLFKYPNKIYINPTGKNNTLIGQAFDYAFRYYIKLKNQNSNIVIIEPTELIFELSYNRILKEINSDRLFSLVYNHPELSQGILKNIDKKTALERLISAKRLADESIHNYLSNGKLSRKFLQSMFFLANLDIYHRSRNLYSNFDQITNTEINELKKLINSIDVNLFTSNKFIHLNPSFGVASEMIYGADADLIIDDTLVEIKVVKEIKLKQEYFHQLLGYYFLSEIGHINGDEKYGQIKYIGIYFARHKFFWKYPISEIVDKNTSELFKNWLFEYLNTPYQIRLENKLNHERILKEFKNAKSKREINSLLKKYPKYRNYYKIKYGSTHVSKNKKRRKPKKI